MLHLWCLGWDTSGSSQAEVRFSSIILNISWFCRRSDLVQQEVSYPADDDASIHTACFLLALPLPLQQAEEVLRVQVQEIVQSWKQLLHCLQLQLQLLLQTFAVNL